MPSDVLITPASSKIDFTDGSNATKRLNISGTAFSFNSNLNVLSSTSLSSAFKAEGVNGTLFEVTDDLSNSLMSVNTIGGLPVFEVFANNSIIGGQYGANDFVISGNKIGLGYANPVNKLSVSGSVSIGSSYNVAAPSNGLIVQGNVGIGTVSPTNGTLQVYNASGNTLSLQKAAGGAALAMGSETTVYALIESVNSGGIKFYTGNGSQTERWTITAAGILQSNGAQTIRTSIDSLTLATNGGNGHIILSPHGNGNVGIGTVTPAYKLDVNGTTRFGGIVYNEAVQTDDFNYFNLQPYIESETLSTILSVSGTAPTFTTLTNTAAPFSKVLSVSAYGEATMSDFIPVQAGETIYGEIWAYRATGATGTAGVLYCGVQRYDKDKKMIDSNAGLNTSPSGYFIASNQTIPSNSTWTKYSGTLVLPTSHTVYNNSDGGPVRYIRPYIIYNYTGGTILTYITGWKIRKVELTRDSGIVSINGSVGVGTISPNEKLSVYPGITGGIALQAGDGTTRSYYFIDNTNPTYSTGIRTNNYYLDFDSSGASQNAIRFYTGTSTIGTGTERMRITSNGNIGIGLVTSPNHLLHLSTVSNDVSIGLYSTNANASARNWLISTNEIAYGDFNIKQSNAIGGNPRSAGTSRFYIQNDGNVGIGGAISPIGKLQLGADYANDGYGGYDIYVKSTTAGTLSSYDPRVQNTSVFSLLITDSSSTTTGPDKIGLVLHNNNATAGAFSPMLLFTKKESGSTPYKATMAGIYARSPLGTGDTDSWIDGELIFATAGAASEGIKQRMVINKEGYVGIGTTIPTAKLDALGVRLGRDFSLANRATVRLDSNGTSYPSDVLFGHTVAANQDGWNGVYWSLSSRAAANSNRFYFYRGTGNPAPNNSEAVIMSFDPTLNVGVGFEAPTNRLSIAGSVSIGSGYNTAATTNGLIVEGNVGIGVTDPTAKLDVAGTNVSGYSLLLRSGDNYNQTDSVQIAFGFANQTNYRHSIRTRHNPLAPIGGVVGNNIDFYVWKRGTDAAADLGSQFVMTMQGDGNVGIGTTNPTNKLHVYSSDNELVFIRGTTAGAWINVQSSTSNLWSIGADGVNGFSVYNRNSNNYALIVRNDGNLGIGNITTASNKLHVNGSASIGSNYNTAAPTNGLIVEGSVGIGITNPADKLHVIGNIRINGGDILNWSGQAFIQTIGANDMFFRPNSTLQMILTAGGNLGVGNGFVNPLAKLHLNSTTSGATLLRADGTNGTLFSVVDDLSDSLMSVNNSAGLPVLEVFADDRVVAGQYGANDFVLVNNKLGLGTNSPAYKLDVRGSTVNARVGLMEFGSWPLDTTYIYLQNNTLSLIGANYGFLQGPTGETFVNAASGQTLHFRTGNAQRWAITSDSTFYTGTGFDASNYLILQNNTNEYGRVGLFINAKTFSAANTPSTNDGWSIDPRSGIRFRGWLVGDSNYDTKFVIQHLLANATNAAGDLGIFAKGFSTTIPAFVLTGGGRIGISTTTPAALLQIGTGTPTAVTGGIQFGDDTTARIYRTNSSTIQVSNNLTVGGTITGALTGNVIGNVTGSSGSAGYLTGGDSAFYAILYNTTSADLNTFNTAGLHSAEYTGSTNNPTGSVATGHFIQISDAGGTDVKTQWYYNNAGSDIYMRLMWGNGTWRSWRKLLHDGNYTSYPDATKLPLAGGTMTGVLTTYTPGVQTSLINLSAFNAGINVGERNVGSAAGFVPGYGQTTIYTGGYRSHMILGSYRTASAWGGGPFIAWGGNDNYPTEYWLFNQGGAITHSSGITFLNTNSTLTAGNLSGTIPSAVLGNSALFIGTTSIALNRASAALTLNGVNISGTAASETLGTVTGRGASTSTQISVGTTAGGSMYTGIKSGAGYSDAVSGATFKSITDHPTGGSFAFAAYYNGAPGTGTNSFYVAANGGAYFAQGVGIGVTPPLQALHINGNIILDGTTNGYTQSATRGIGYGSNNGAISVDGFSGMDIQSVNAPAPNNGNYSQNLRFWTHHYGTGTGATPRMFLQYNGNLGIGTVSPTAKLNVLSSTSLSSVFKTEGVNGTLFEVTDDLSNSLMSVNTIGGLPVFEVFANNSVIAGQYGQNDFVISGNKIGLGTASPIYKLDVRDNVNSEPYSVAFFRNTNTSNSFGGIIVNGDNQAHIRFLTGASTWGAAGAKQWQIRTGAANNVDALSIYSWTTGSDVLYINSSGNVGIGTVSPSQILDVRGNIKLGADNSGNYIYYVTDIERTIIRTARSDVSQVGLFRSDGWGNFTVDKSIGIGYSLGSNFASSTIGNGNLYVAGYVGIGTTTPATLLQIGTGTPTAATLGVQFGGDTAARIYRIGSSTIRISNNLTVGGTLTESSSIRYKENIQTVSAPILPKLNEIRPVTYNKKDNPNNIEYGIIAEELNDLFPELVNKNNNGEVESVNYSRLTVLLIKAVKELKQEIEILKNK